MVLPERIRRMLELGLDEYDFSITEVIGCCNSDNQNTLISMMPHELLLHTMTDHIVCLNF